MLPQIPIVTRNDGCLFDRFISKRASDDVTRGRQAAYPPEDSLLYRRPRKATVLGPRGRSFVRQMGITNEGRLFVQGEHQVRKLAVIYDGKCTGHEGPLIGIRDALGDRFDYPELMRGAK